MKQSGAPCSRSQVSRLLPYRGSVPDPAALSGPWGCPWGPLGCPGAAAECPASCWHPPLSPGEPSSASRGLSGPCTPWSLSLLVLSRWPQDEVLLGQAPLQRYGVMGTVCRVTTVISRRSHSLPAPGALGVGCVSRGWVPTVLQVRSPISLALGGPLRSDQRTVQSGHPSVPRVRPAAAGGGRQTRSAPPPAWVAVDEPPGL